MSCSLNGHPAEGLIDWIICYVGAGFGLCVASVVLIVVGLALTAWCWIPLLAAGLGFSVGTRRRKGP